jgi:hypothetical protein
MIYKIEPDWNKASACISVNKEGDINGDYDIIVGTDNWNTDGNLIIGTIDMFESILKKNGQGVLMTDNVKLKLAGSLAMYHKAYFCDEVNEDSRVLLMTRVGVICR